MSWQDDYRALIERKANQFFAEHEKDVGKWLRMWYRMQSEMNIREADCYWVFPIQWKHKYMFGDTALFYNIPVTFAAIPDVLIGVKTNV